MPTKTSDFNFLYFLDSKNNDKYHRVVEKEVSVQSVLFYITKKKKKKIKWLKKKTGFGKSN